MIRLKPGTKVKDLHSEMVLAIHIVDRIYEANGAFETWVTSALDGIHEDYSPHYLGRAVDFRTHNVDPTKLGGLQLAISEALGAEYQVLLEYKGLPNEHLHVQSDRGGASSGAPQHPPWSG